MALALVVAVPQGARSQAVCVDEFEVGSSLRDADVRLRLPDRPSRREPSEGTPRPGSGTVERTAGAVSTDGRNGVVHGGYRGCGERIQFDGADDGGRLSYVRSHDGDPWRRLDGDPFAAEHFFDAELEGPDGGPVSGGYALNAYAAESRSSPFSDRTTTRNVAGSTFWLNGLDERIQLTSSLGMDEPTADGTVPLAHRHEVDIEPLRFGDDGAVFANLSYAQGDAGFAAGRGAHVPADARAWSVGAGLRMDGATARLDYRRGRDNLDETQWQAIRSYQEWAGRVDLDAPLGGGLAPDLITLRGRTRTDRADHEDRFADARQRHATAGWGVNMLWRDDQAFGGIDVSGRVPDSGAVQTAGVLPSQRLGLSLGADVGDVRVSSRLYSERQSLAAAPNDDVAMDHGGALAAALFGQRLEGSMAYGRTATNAFVPALRWGLAAELDAVDLLGRDSFRLLGEDVFALGRLESNFAEDRAGWRADYIAKFVAGFRF